MAETVTSKSLLVIGGGISGVTAAIEAAEAGAEVILVEKNPYLGGRVAQMNQYFPKLCPPSCGLEINFKRIKNNPRVKFYTNAEVTSVLGSRGNFDVAIKVNPRFVNDSCTACGECVDVCPEEKDNAFNYGLDRNKAIYLPHEMAFPFRYVVDAEACKGKECGKCLAACKYNAIDLDMQVETINVNVGSIVCATGWKPYDVEKLDNLNAGQSPDIITNVQMERLAAGNGPTGGKITRPSDGKEIESIAFVQCAGSRDENHLPYCSAVCCMASLKQSTYVRERYPDAEIYMFYIDVRAQGRLEDFYTKVYDDDQKFTLIKGKVAGITMDGGDLLVEAEDTLTGKKSKQKVNMVVLATGMEPNKEVLALSGIDDDGFGFVYTDPDTSGIVAAGCSKKPAEVSACVQDATAAALKAIQGAK